MLIHTHTIRFMLDGKIVEHEAVLQGDAHVDTKRAARIINKELGIDDPVIVGVFSEHKRRT